MFGIDDAIAAGSKLADDIVTRIWPDATEVERQKIAQATAEMQNTYQLMLEQIKTNQVEAQSGSIFVSGWRPMVGWICGLALAYSAIFEPLLRFVSRVCFAYTGSFPLIDSTITMQVLFGMLGLGAMRSFDKHSENQKK